MKKTKYTDEQIAFALKQVETGTRLDEENRRLKKLVADLSLDKEMLQEVLRKMYGPPRVRKG